MKKLFSLIAALSLLALGLADAQAQLLTNGSLDATSISSQVLATPTGWTVAASRSISGVFNDAASSEGFAGDPANTVDTGAGDMGLFFKPFSGNDTDGDVTVHFTQDNAGTAGKTYRLTAYAGAEANYSGLIPGSRTKSELAVEFLDAASSVIGGTTLDLRAAGLGSTGTGLHYAQYSVSDTAPAGTASVRARASMIDAFGNPAGGGQAYVVDDFSLAVVPEPSTLALAALGLAAMIRRRK